MDYSAQGYKNIDKTDDDKARSSRTRILVCGGLLTIIITISVIIGVVLNQKSMADDNGTVTDHTGKGPDKNDAGLHFSKCESDHPMCQFYGTEPDWEDIATKQGKGADEIKQEFWLDEIFGGPLFDGVHIAADDAENERLIGNSLEKALEDDYADRGKGENGEEDMKHAVFVIKNLHQYEGNLQQIFMDVTFWAQSISNDDFEKLNAINDTKVDDGQERNWSEYSPLINGWARVISYKVDGPYYFDGTTTFDPRNPPSNVFLKVFEGYLENGLVTDDPKFGRFYIMGDKCNVGYFIQKPGDERSYDPVMEGKGIQIQQSHAHEEGIWDSEQPNNVYNQKTIEDFNENELPPQ